MIWSWQLKEWPKFNYDPEDIALLEKQFFIGSGGMQAFLKAINKDEFDQFIVEILCTEGIESSKIEGEYLDRESLQSSIRRHLEKKTLKNESAMAKLAFDVQVTFDQPLDHDMLFRWYKELFNKEAGKYRSGPMQSKLHVHYEAPGPSTIDKEMEQFIRWYNGYQGSTLVKAAIAHLYFEMIHPFEDGNGRIGRLLIEKVLSQGLGKPVLIAVSRVFERRKKEYYEALGRCNCTLDVQPWIHFFAGSVLEAQVESIQILEFLIKKTKFFLLFKEKLNPRQENALLKIFDEGIDGFKGGLSATNYSSITNTSKATATRDLFELVEMGALVKTGELRHRRYWLNI